MLTSTLTPEGNTLAELAMYGLARDVAKKLAPKLSGGKPDFFGFKQTSDGYDMEFTPNPLELSDDMTLSLIAPPDEPFDMLVTKPIKEILETSNTDTLRALVAKILDEV